MNKQVSRSTPNRHPNIKESVDYIMDLYEVKTFLRLAEPMSIKTRCTQCVLVGIFDKYTRTAET